MFLVNVSRLKQNRTLFSHYFGLKWINNMKILYKLTFNVRAIILETTPVDSWSPKNLIYILGFAPRRKMDFFETVPAFLSYIWRSLVYPISAFKPF